jgi:hypothetical protein
MQHDTSRTAIQPLAMARRRGGECAAPRTSDEHDGRLIFQAVHAQRPLRHWVYDAQQVRLRAQRAPDRSV